jgi:hypothetical protein
MPAVATRPISHVVTDERGKVVKTITFAKGDVIHDDDVHEVLKVSHGHSLTPITHTRGFAKPEVTV